MADVERIAPTIPTLPAPIGRGVGSQRRRAPRQERPSQPEPEREQHPENGNEQPTTDHIDEYV
jgi:hypothetical protein